MTARIINIALGLWLLFAPSFCQLEKAQSAVYYILAPLILSTAIISLSESVRNFRYFNVVLALCLIFSFLMFSLSWQLIVHQVLTGGIILVCALQKGKIKHAFNGGWRSLFRN